MRIQRLSISRFRNLSDVDFEPDPGLNLFLGDNGQGKTSVLEAVALLASLRSFRDSKSQDWIQNGENRSDLDAWLIPESEGSDDTDVSLWKTHFHLDLQTEAGVAAPTSTPIKKTVAINGKRVRNGAGFLKQKFGAAELAFHTISFNPSDHDLIRGEPAQRRAHLDRVISAEDAGYLENLIKYNKLVEHRNALLKDPGGRFGGMLREFTLPLIPLSARVIRSRLVWFEKNAEIIKEIAHRIAPDQAPLELSYVTKKVEKSRPENDEKNKEIGILSGAHFAGQHPLPSLEVLEKWMESRFAAVEAEELRQGVTLLGPHRDDWVVGSQENSLKGRGSQGEVRTALLALKLGEIKSFQSSSGHKPVLLLDDFSSELDLRRRKCLMEYIEATALQVWVTSTESSGLPGKKFRVTSGEVRSE